MVTPEADGNDGPRLAGRFGVLDPRHWHDQQKPRLRRGVYLLPSLFTMGNMFCGYLCVLYAIRGEFAVAAPFIGVAVVLDMLDGRIARMTGTSTAFGVEFDSLADVISFGIAPAVLVFMWGLQPLQRRGKTRGPTIREQPSFERGHVAAHWQPGIQDVAPTIAPHPQQLQ